MLQGISLKKEEREREREKERERERERKNDMGRPALMKPGLQLYFQKGLLYPELHISRSERYKFMLSQLNITSVLPLSKPRHFLHSFS